jgi:hypothetical protein
MPIPPAETYARLIAALNKIAADEDVADFTSALLALACEMSRIPGTEDEPLSDAFRRMTSAVSIRNQARVQQVLGAFKSKHSRPA